MTESSEVKKEVPTIAPQNKAPLRNPPPKSFGNNNPVFNKFWSKWKWWWGPQAIRKHAARSR